jgi:hypothetical protein
MKFKPAKHMMDGFALSERQLAMTDIASTFSEDQPLHERLARHLENCSKCQASLIKRPMGFGTVTDLCSDYQAIIAEWANREGEVNNIVDHDEFGNKASGKVHENYPTQWR